MPRARTGQFRSAEQPWSPEEDQRLLSARTTGMPFPQIVQELLPGRTTAAACARFHSLRWGGCDDTPAYAASSARNYTITDEALASSDISVRSDAARGSRALLKAVLRYYARRHQYPRTMSGLEFRRLCAAHDVKVRG